MKILKKAVAFILLATMLLASCQLFVSCGDEEPDKGQLLATYSGGEIYESDVKDWKQLLYYTYFDNIMKAEDQKGEFYAVFDLATSYVVKMKAFEKLLADNGYKTFSETAIKKEAEEIIKSLNEEFEGGYDAWKKGYRLSDDFIYSYAELQLVSSEMEKYIMSRYGIITDEMINEYWTNYAGDYVQVPSYYFDNIIVSLPKSEMAGEAAWEEIKAEAQSYIDRINAGEDFEMVKQDAISKSRYATAARLYSIAASLRKGECEGFDDLEAILEDNKRIVNALCEELKVQFVEYADPNGDKDEYEVWYDFVNMNNEASVKNALLNLEEGEVWATPIMSVFGYQIVKLTKSDENVYFRNPTDYPDVYQDVYNKLYAQLWNEGEGPAVKEFEKDLIKDYKIEIVYSYVSEYVKGNLG